MEIETYAESDGTHHIVFWYKDMVKSHHIYNSLEDFEEALIQLCRQYPLAKVIPAVNCGQAA